MIWNMMVYQVYLVLSIKGCPWEGSKRLDEWVIHWYVHPSLIKDGRAYWLQAWTELVLSYVVRPWPRTDEHTKFSLNMLLDFCVRNNLWFFDPKPLLLLMKCRFKYHNFHSGYEFLNKRNGYRNNNRSMYAI